MKTEILVFFAILISVIILIATSTNQSFHQDLTINLHGEGNIFNCVRLEVNDIPFYNNTRLDWGEMQPNTIHIKNLSVTNITNSSLTIRLKVLDITEGCVFLWELNNTSVAPQERVTAPMVLSIHEEAPSGPFTMNLLLTVEQ